MLHGWLDPLHRFGEWRGDRELIRENGLRLLAAAHIQRLRDQAPASQTQELAAQALDRFEGLAALGDADAAFRVAEAHRTGFGRPHDHWKTLAAYDRAADLGHPLAAERRQQVATFTAIQDDRHERFARQALLKATYEQRRAQAWTQAARQGYRDFREHGLGLRPVLAILAAAALVGSYIALDFYFFGLGQWRPDPGRVAWGLAGKIHPPKDSDARRVLPQWLRPDVRSAAFHQQDFTAGALLSRDFSLGDCQGRVVLLHVVDDRKPILHEAQGYLVKLQERLAGRADILVVYLPDATPLAARAWIQELTGILVCVPTNPRALRPLGTITTYPMTFVLDRQGRIRQRWTGFGQALTEEALAGALAET